MLRSLAIISLAVAPVFAQANETQPKMSEADVAKRMTLSTQSFSAPGSGPGSADSGPASSASHDVVLVVLGLLVLAVILGGGSGGTTAFTSR